MNEIKTVTTPDAIDVHVGARLKTRRVELNVSQTALGEAVGVTFQQIQKYERGTNRISASVLWKLCQELAILPNHLFEGL